MRLIFTGGGTGGHIIPIIALVESMRTKYGSLKMLYLGTGAPLEYSLCQKYNITLQPIAAGKLRRYFSLSNFTDIVKLPIGVIQALWHIWRFKPDIVWSKGGYVSVPVVFAACLLRKRIIIHESDVVPGLATRLCAPFADIICLGWKESVSFFKKYQKKIHITGIPLRKGLCLGNRQRACAKFHISDKKPTLLVMGGSLGAEFINTLIYKTVKELAKKFQIIHITGVGKLIQEKEKSQITDRLSDYHAVEFLNEELFDLYEISDIVVCRAGANTLAELMTLKKKVILIPLSLEASRGDQIKNAQAYAQDYKNCIILPQEKATPERLIAAVERLLSKKNNLPFSHSRVSSFHSRTHLLHTHASDTIIRLIEQLTAT